MDGQSGGWHTYAGASWGPGPRPSFPLVHGLPHLETVGQRVDQGALSHMCKLPLTRFLLGAEAQRAAAPKTQLPGRGV